MRRLRPAFALASGASSGKPRPLVWRHNMKMPRLMPMERVLRIEEHGVPVRPPIPMLAAREAQSDAPPIAAGRMELRAQVTLTAVLK